MNYSAVCISLVTVFFSSMGYSVRSVPAGNLLPEPAWHMGHPARLATLEQHAISARMGERSLNGDSSFTFGGSFATPHLGLGWDVVQSLGETFFRGGLGVGNDFLQAGYRYQIHRGRGNHLLSFHLGEQQGFQMAVIAHEQPLLALGYSWESLSIGFESRWDMDYNDLIRVDGFVGWRVDWLEAQVGYPIYRYTQLEVPWSDLLMATASLWWDDEFALQVHWYRPFRGFGAGAQLLF